MIDAMNPRIARLRRHLDVSIIEGEGAYLISDRGVSVIEGPLGAALGPRLDGARTVEEIVTELAPSFPAERVRQAIDRLVAAGVAVLADSRDGDRLGGDAGLYEMAGIESALAARRLARATVALFAIGDVDVTAVLHHLREGGVGAIAEAGTVEGATLSVVVTDDYLRRDLEELNRASLAARTPWLLTRPEGSTVWVGPLFRPGETGCWSCLAHRLSAHREGQSYLERRLGREVVSTPRARHHAGAAVGAGLAALTALKALAGLPPAAPAVVTTDLLSGETTRHLLTQRPQCPICGDGSMMASRALAPVRFTSRPKAPSSDGGHRAVSPEAMVARFADQVSPITGVVTALEPLSLGAGGLHVFSAGQNVSRRPADLSALRRGLRASSCGKGKSEIQAKASAMGEAIERSSGVFQGDELRRKATFAEMGEEAIHPNACMLFSERQYAMRALWNLGASGFNAVFHPFDERASIEWSPVWSVTAERHRWLPTAYLYYGYPPEGDRLFTYADSNGCAAGTSLEDAALQGFCELVERDSVALFWYNRARRPGIDLDSFADPYLDRLREAYASFGREIWALDLTADLGIPAVGAFSRRLGAAREDILIAFGAHLDPRVALLRALTEMNQFLPAVVPGPGGEARLQFSDEAFNAWCRTATLENQPHLAPDPAAPARAAGSWPSLSTDDLGADLARCQRLVEAAGLELLVLDQTRPDVGLPVVKVIVPGLRHFWPRFAPGRLYDVPVALGWQREKTEEHLLNPIPIFI